MSKSKNCKYWQFCQNPLFLVNAHFSLRHCLLYFHCITETFLAGFGFSRILFENLSGRSAWFLSNWSKDEPQIGTKSHEMKTNVRLNFRDFFSASPNFKTSSNFRAGFDRTGTARWEINWKVLKILRFLVGCVCLHETRQTAHEK